MISLNGKRVLVTRPDPQGQALCDLINAHGGSAVHLPTIIFGPPPDPILFEQQLKQLPSQDWLIFISAQAVAAVQSSHASIAVNQQLQIAAIGEGTKVALLNAGLRVDISPQDLSNSENLLALPQFLNVEHLRIAVIRGLGGREQIDPTLAARGAEVLTLLAYQRCLPMISAQEHQQLVKALPQLDTIVCTSFNGLENLCSLVGGDALPALKRIPLLVMSERIKKLGIDLGFQTIWVANTNYVRQSDYNHTLLTALI